MESSRERELHTPKSSILIWHNMRTRMFNCTIVRALSALSRQFFVRTSLILTVNCTAGCTLSTRFKWIPVIFTGSRGCPRLRSRLCLFRPTRYRRIAYHAPAARSTASFSIHLHPPQVMEASYRLESVDQPNRTFRPLRTLHAHFLW